MISAQFCKFRNAVFDQSQGEVRRASRKTYGHTNEHTGNLVSDIGFLLIDPPLPDHLHQTVRNAALGQKSPLSNSASSLGLGRERNVKGTGSKGAGPGRRK